MRTLFDTRAAFIEPPAATRSARPARGLDRGPRLRRLAVGGRRPSRPRCRRFLRQSAANHLRACWRSTPSGSRSRAALHRRSCSRMPSNAQCRVVPAHAASRFGEACSMMIVDRSLLVRRFHRDHPRGAASSTRRPPARGSTSSRRSGRSRRRCSHRPRSVSASTGRAKPAICHESAELVRATAIGRVSAGPWHIIADCLKPRAHPSDLMWYAARRSREHAGPCIVLRPNESLRTSVARRAESRSHFCATHTFISKEGTMKKTLLVASLLAAVSLAACGKKEESRLPTHDHHDDARSGSGRHDAAGRDHAACDARLQQQQHDEHDACAGPGRHSATTPAPATSTTDSTRPRRPRPTIRRSNTASRFCTQRKSRQSPAFSCLRESRLQSADSTRSHHANPLVLVGDADPIDRPAGRRRERGPGERRRVVGPAEVRRDEMAQPRPVEPRHDLGRNVVRQMPVVAADAALQRSMDSRTPRASRGRDCIPSRGVAARQADRRCAACSVLHRSAARGDATRRRTRIASARAHRAAPGKARSRARRRETAHDWSRRERSPRRSGRSSRIEVCRATPTRRPGASSPARTRRRRGHRARA